MLRVLRTLHPAQDGAPQAEPGAAGHVAGAWDAPDGARVQNDLFDVGADLSTPVVEDPKYPPLRVEQFYVDRLEEDCDRFNEQLEKLRSFILPGGTPGAALLHQACTVVRRAERSTWAALEVHGETMNPLTATYLNRLSDLLFILGRVANPDGDVLWQPGGPHGAPPAT